MTKLQALTPAQIKVWLAGAAGLARERPGNKVYLRETSLCAYAICRHRSRTVRWYVNNKATSTKQVAARLETAHKPEGSR